LGKNDSGRILFWDIGKEPHIPIGNEDYRRIKELASSAKDREKRRSATTIQAIYL
jgi:hypothetical protein